MVEHWDHDYESLKTKLLEAVSDYEYRHERYKIDYSIAVVYMEEAVDFDAIISKHTRKTDTQIILDDHVYAIILDCTDTQKGLKAASNLFTYFQTLYFAHTLYAAVVTSREKTSSSRLISELLGLLEYARSHNLHGGVVESSQIMKNE